ncbi:MAG: hypothetical protein U5R06_17030 [candidate division KSB1 bacterium]|nr:hypothetical protein [candidate division KSB1 bacterium]
MKKNMKRSVVLLLLAGFPGIWIVSAQTNHSVSYSRMVQSAVMPPRGHVYTLLQFATFRSSPVEYSPDRTEQISDKQFESGVFYSPYSGLGFGGLVMLLKSNHRPGQTWSSPAHVDLWATWGTRPLNDSTFFMAVRFSSRVPLDTYTNPPLSYYATRHVRFGVGGLASWIVLREECFDVQLDFNTQLLDHNDRGLNLTTDEKDNLTVEKSTKEIVYGMSAQSHYKAMAFYVELYGRQFVQRPPISAYTRENSLIMNSGFTLEPMAWLNLNVSLTVLLRGGTDRTDYMYSYADPFWAKAPNLPAWRIRAGLGVTLDAGESRNRGDDLRDALGASPPVDTSETDLQFDRERFLEKLRHDDVSEREFIETYQELLLQEREEKEKMLKELRERLQEEREKDTNP